MHQKLSVYRIEDLIGEGSFARVYRAFDEKLERFVALKVLKPEWLTDPQTIARFKHEAKTMANLHHAHIVDVYDVGEADGYFYLAQRFIEGETLANRLTNGTLTWDEVVKIATRIGSALDYAHEHDIIHRDVKPQNILLDKKNWPYLTDFGLVRAVEGSIAGSAAMSMVGTAHYMASELWDGKNAVPASDIYALSCVVYEMITGKVLFEGSSPMQVMRKHDQGPKFPETWLKNVPAGVTDVLQRGLAKDPAERVSSAGDLARQLAALPLPSIAPPPNGPAPRSLGLIIGRVVGIVLIVVIIANLSRSGRLPSVEQTLTPSATLDTKATDGANPTTVMGGDTTTVEVPPTNTPTLTDTPQPPTATATTRPTQTIAPTHTPTLPARINDFSPAALQAIARIKASRVITVGVRHDAPPYGMNTTIGDDKCQKSEETEGFWGYDIQIVRDFVPLWGIEEVTIKLKCTPVGLRNEFVRNGTVSIGVFSFAYDTKMRCVEYPNLPNYDDPKDLRVWCSDPYMLDGLGILVNQANNEIEEPCDIGGKKVAILVGTTAETGLRDQVTRFCNEFQASSPPEPTPIGSREEALTKLGNNDVDAYMTNLEILNGLVGLPEYQDQLRLLEGSFGPEEPFVIAVNPGETELLTLINETIAHMKSHGILADLMRDAKFLCETGDHALGNLCGLEPIDEPKLYKVQPGNFLANIAIKAYGYDNAALWPCIDDANDNIGEDGGVKVGQIIKLPDIDTCINIISTQN
jgi:serine/threonine protein kinase